MMELFLSSRLRPGLDDEEAEAARCSKFNGQQQDVGEVLHSTKWNICAGVPDGLVLVMKRSVQCYFTYL